MTPEKLTEIKARAEKMTLSDAITYYRTDIPDLIAAVEERDARIAELERALLRLRDCDWVIRLPDRMDAVRDIAATALDRSHAIAAYERQENGE